MNQVKAFRLFASSIAWVLVAGLAACDSDPACEQLVGRSFQSGQLNDCGREPNGNSILCPTVLRFQNRSTYHFGHGKVMTPGSYTCKKGRLRGVGPDTGAASKQHSGYYDEIHHVVVWDALQFYDTNEEASKESVATGTEVATKPSLGTN